MVIIKDVIDDLFNNLMLIMEEVVDWYFDFVFCQWVNGMWSDWLVFVVCIEQFWGVGVQVMMIVLDEFFDGGCYVE